MEFIFVGFTNSMSYIGTAETMAFSSVPLMTFVFHESADVSFVSFTLKVGITSWD